MNESSLKKSLSKLNLSGLRYFDSSGSTNDEALAWAASGADDFSLVVADEQTQGRGRLDRKWFTPKGSALAVSLILRPAASMRPHLSRTVGLAALSIVDACLKAGLNPQIKWPNDILVGNKKLAGILVESVWSGEDVDSLVVGMGVNIYKASVPPPDGLNFPATSLEHALGGEPPKREEFLFNLLSAFLAWREHIASDSLLAAWEEKLAFHNETVHIHTGSGDPLIGRLDGLESDGSLRLRDTHDNSIIVRFGDVSLRPAA